MLVVQHARRPEWSHAKMYGNKKRRKLKIVMTFSEVEHGHDNPVTCLQCVRFNKSIMYVIMHKEKMPINMLPHSKAPGKTTNCGNRHAKKTRGLF